MDYVYERTQPRALKRRVYFLGDVALNEGVGVNYDRDLGTATENNGKRDKDVQVTDNTNNLSFAGVVQRGYDAVTGGQWITIYEPGSVAQVRVSAATTIGEKAFVTCIAGGSNAGEFRTGGLPGRGTARILQTQASANSLCLVQLMTGDESGEVEELTPVASSATQSMIGGVTLIQAVTIAGHSTSVLADGTYNGQKKGFVCDGTVTTNDYNITVTSGIRNSDGAATLAAVSMDAANEYIFLTWHHADWIIDSFKGATLS